MNQNQIYLYTPQLLETLINLYKNKKIEEVSISDRYLNTIEITENSNISELIHFIKDCNYELLRIKPKKRKNYKTISIYNINDYRVSKYSLEIYLRKNIINDKHAERSEIKILFY